jgi:hypothetical protein
MRNDEILHQRNVAVLEGLQIQIVTLASTVDELIVLNERALTKAVLKAASERALTDASGKRVMLSKDIEALLRLAGSEGLTVSELTHLILKTRKANPQTIRSTLYRFRDRGFAELRKRRWRLIQEL